MQKSIPVLNSISMQDIVIGFIEGKIFTENNNEKQYYQIPSDYSNSLLYKFNILICNTIAQEYIVKFNMNIHAFEEFNSALRDIWSNEVSFSKVDYSAVNTENTMFISNDFY